MITVWKFATPVSELSDELNLMMPDFAIILSVGVQKIAMPRKDPNHFSHEEEHLCVWARVDTEQPKVRRRFRVAGTGHPLNPNKRIGNYGGSFVGTVQFESGLVLHVFDEGVR